MPLPIRSIFYAILALLVLLPASAFAVADPSKSFANPLTQRATPLSLADSVGLVVRGLLGFSGVLAIAFIVLGGIRIVVASGNEEQIKQGQQTLLWAILGLVVAFGGYIVVGAVVENASRFFGS